MLLGTPAYFAVIAAACVAVADTRECPCDNTTLCQVVSGYSNEVYAFVLKSTKEVWSQFDWNKLTTIALDGFYDPDLYCLAHQHGVAVTFTSDYPAANLTNSTQRELWVKQQVQYALDYFLDGINIDFEDPVPEGSPEVLALTALVNETTNAFHSTIPGSQVTFDVAWSPNGIDGRYFDALALAKSCDFLFVMSYDEQSQIFDDSCTARPNSGFYQTTKGLQQYLELGIPADKLVLGIPWYGYDYKCVYLDKENVCSIPHVPFRGVNCSDAAGVQRPINVLLDLLANYSTSGKLWNNQTLTPYFNYKDPTSGQMHQVQYDDVSSLTIKYLFAKTTNLRGVGMWNANCLDYSGAPGSNNLNNEMWGALPDYRNPAE